MCGIFFSFSENEIIIKDNILFHRGPDDWGVESFSVGENKVNLFQSRLSIIGLGPQGHQPFKKNENYILIFNGEIYNYKELGKALTIESGINFNTSTDTEVLYELLINKGIEDTLARINGIFAFIFYDKDRNKIYSARDPLGIKPLYYYRNGTQLFLSSEAKVFFELGLLTPKLNKSVLGEYFANGWVYEPYTMFKDIFKIEAGHYLDYDISKNDFRISKYWDIQNNFLSKEIDEDHILKTIRNQTISDVPFGIYFSGGIDSSLLTHELLDQKPYCLNLNLKDSETQRVNYFENKFGLEINRVEYDDSLLSTYSDLIYHLDEPVADPAIIPSYFLAKSSRDAGRIVMLSGMGGDEIDTGYNRHKIIMNFDRYKIFGNLPSINLLPPKLLRDYARLSEFMKMPEPSNYFSLTAYYSGSEIKELINSEWHNEYKTKIDTLVANFDGLKKFFYLDIKGFLISHNLLYVDKTSMAASVEVRVPFLDKDVAAYFFNTLPEQKGSYSLKPRLTKMLRDKLGKDYTALKKQGFRYPVDQWMKDKVNWLEIISFFNENKLLNTFLIKKWLNVFEKKPSLVSMKLFYIYTLYIWIKTFKVNVN